MIKYIYEIKNKINNKSYIGQSVNPKARFYNHIKVSQNKNKREYNKPLYKDIRKYGKNNFKLIILARVLKNSKLYNIENSYIIKQNTLIPNGYNIELSRYNAIHSQRKRFKKLGITKNILLNEINEFGFRGTGIKYNVSDNTIKNWCKKLKISNKASDYSRKYFKNKMKIIGKKFSTTKKPTLMLDKETNKVVKEFESISDAAKFINVSVSNLQKVISHFENRKTCKGYKWELK